MKLIELSKITLNIISDKYEQLIKEKDFTKDVVYFSNLEYVSVVEICELIDEYLIIKGSIEEELDKKKTEDDKYLTEELKGIQEYMFHFDETGRAKLTLLWIFREYD